MSISYIRLRRNAVHHRAYLITLCSLVIVVIICYYNLTPSKLQGSDSMMATRADDGFEPTGNISRNETHVVLSAPSEPVEKYKYPHEIVVASVVCSKNRIFEEFTVMVKSAVLCQQSSELRFIIFSDEMFFSKVEKFLQDTQSVAKNPFSYQVQPACYPENLTNFIARREHYTVCGSLRIFLPDMLQNEKYLLYVDTDTIFVNKLSVIWERFVSLCTEGRLAVIMEDDIDLTMLIKNSFRVMAEVEQLPIVGKLGVNSGIMFMNLLEMSKQRWVETAVWIMKKYKKRQLWQYDQHVINMAFAMNYADKYQIGPCTYNYRVSHCISTNFCEEVRTDGASILHGYMKTFHPGRPFGVWSHSFNLIYQSILQYEFGTDPYTNMIEPMLLSIQLLPPVGCPERANQILQNFVGLFPQS